MTHTFPKFRHLLWATLFFICARGGFYLLTDGFSVFKIQNTFPVTRDWQLPAPSNEQQGRLKEICARPFTYLGKGSQAYAFLSEDKQYVMKVFKCYHLSPVRWLEKMPLPTSLSEFRDQALEKRNKKIRDTLRSYKIASHTLSQECGLIALEILPTEGFHQEVTLIDKLGRTHRLDLGSIGFIVQKRADLVYPSLSNWIAHGQYDQAKQALQSIVELIVQRSVKGVQDSDPDLHKNAGLIGTEAMFIDIGSLHANEAVRQKEVYVHDLYKITNRLHQWLEKQSPELANYLREIIQSEESVGAASF